MESGIKSWCPEIEVEALEQAKQARYVPCTGGHIALMPDAHLGYGVPIGSVICTQGAVIPNAVGVDIGCGVVWSRSDAPVKDVDVKAAMGKIRELVPVGKNKNADGHAEACRWMANTAPIESKPISDDFKRAACQIGTLGGGNHFIELQEDQDGYLCVMIHSGSRHMGKEIATYYHNIAKELCSKWHTEIPSSDLALLPLNTPEGEAYMRDMEFACEYAEINREFMMDMAKHAVGDAATWEKNVDVRHNYAAMENHFGKNVLVHRKGATRARVGDMCLIPGSMGTHSYVCKGLGNKDSYTSCSHGAGRAMSRTRAKKELDLETEKAKLGTSAHGLRNVSDLDEAPGAYKDIESVMKNQEDLVQIVDTLSMVGSIKG